MPRRSLLSAAVFAVATFIATAPLSAQMEFDTKKATYFTFSAPVALPSVTLAPGKYLFRLADSTANRNIVMVYTGDGAKLMSVFLTMPAERNEVSDNAEVRFYETPANTAAPIQSWWFPGQKQGWEFVYPRNQAMEIAKSSTTPVLSTTAQTRDGMTPEQTADAMKNAEVVRVDGQGQAAANDAARVAAAGRAERGEAVTAPPTAMASASTPAANRSASAGNSNTTASMSENRPVEAPAADVRATTTRSTASAAAAQDQAAVTAPARDELPATATMTPLIALVGVLALTTGLVIHSRRRRFE